MLFNRARRDSIYIGKVRSGRLRKAKGSFQHFGDQLDFQKRRLPRRGEISPEIAQKAFLLQKEYSARRMDMNYNMSKLYNKETDRVSQSKLIMDVRALIADQQFARLRQILYQIGGPKLVFKEPLRTKFKVTTEQVAEYKAGLESIAKYYAMQRKKLELVHRAAIDQSMPLDRRTETDFHMLTAKQELDKAIANKVRELAVKILTADQLAQWNEFVGRKFIASEDSE